MEIKLEQKVYPSGTVEISCHHWPVSGDGIPQYLRINVSKLRKTYMFEVSVESFIVADIAKLDFVVDSDLVFDPKSLEVEDWQLLKILHPQVQEYQWKILQTLKDLIDNRVEEEYALAEIKSILQKENKIES